MSKLTFWEDQKLIVKKVKIFNCWLRYRYQVIAIHLLNQNITFKFVQTRIRVLNPQTKISEYYLYDWLLKHTLLMIDELCLIPHHCIVLYPLPNYYVFIFVGHPVEMSVSDNLYSFCTSFTLTRDVIVHIQQRCHR